MIDKNKVNKNFSKGAATYDKGALIQKHMAERMEIFLDGSKKEYKILEVGCGTGIFSERLIKRFPNSKIDLLDISKLMLEKANEKIGENENIRYIEKDIEEFTSSEKYDLIFSNATFQWIDDQSKLFKHLYSLLDFGGRIAFSTFGKRTYCELKESFDMMEGSFCFSQDFISKVDLRESVDDDYTVLLSDEEYMIESYSSVIEFFKAIKSIGSNSANAGGEILTKGKLKELEDIYMSKHGDGSKIDVTNHLIYMVLEKRH